MRWIITQGPIPSPWGANGWKSGFSRSWTEPAIVEYKEALIFAFLGVLYMLDRPSCLSSVTGAARDNIGGMLFKV